MSTPDSTPHKTRKIKFKAWDTESRLLLRLDSIDCNRGELYRQHHILLQYTGLDDAEGREVYEMDVLLISYDKYLVTWNETQNGWYYAPLKQPEKRQPFVADAAGRMKRFCSFFELEP